MPCIGNVAQGCSLDFQEVEAPASGGYLIIGDDVVLSHCMIKDFNKSMVSPSLITGVCIPSGFAQGLTALCQNFLGLSCGEMQTPVLGKALSLHP